MDSAFLTLPAAGDPHFPALTRKLRLLALRRLLRATPRACPAAPARLAEAARAAPEAVLAAVGQVDTLAPLLCAEGGLPAGAGAADAVLPGLWVALQAGGAIAEPLLWDGPVARLVDLPRRRVLRFAAPARGLFVAPGQAELRLADGSIWPLDAPAPAGVDVEHPFLPLAGGAVLSTFDSNPLAHIEAHPEKGGNAVDLGGEALSSWGDALGAAHALVCGALPGWASEWPFALQRVVPVGVLPEVHLSASYREAPGLVYLTLHPNRVTLAEALIHETQHGKLNTLLHLDAVLHNGWTDWTPSPVRPDLRPLMGVLLAVHAFVPVAAFHAALAAAGHPLAEGPWFARRRAEVLAGNARGLDILDARAAPTPAGRRLLDALHAVQDAAVAGLSPGDRAGIAAADALPG
jgi:HEXXH motif-containing protein